MLDRFQSFEAPSAEAAAATKIMNDPRHDWVNPWVAPYYCFSGRYVCTAQEWADALQIEIQAFMKRHKRAPSWSIVYGKKDPGAWIKAMGMEMVIAPGRGFPVCGNRTLEFDVGGLTITGCAPPGQKDDALGWHRLLREYLFRSWKRSFVQAVMFGTAHVMVRKHSILAPFERITFNQWQYFRLDKEVRRPPNKDIQWGDPRLPYLAGRLPWTATGPAGEKLYDIRIAPGKIGKSVDPEQACVEWMVALLREYPDRPSEPLSSFAKEAMSRFPGLTKRGFDRCYFLARKETGNQNWSLAGRKPRQKSARHK
jgi:hypothetical protein